MAAAYDKYDYPSYWKNREYEHLAEVYAIKCFLEQVPKINRVLEIGAGFGRLTPSYRYRAKQVILSDPSARLLRQARQNLQDKKIKFIQSKGENLLKKVKSKSINLIICVRVSHHVNNLDYLFSVVSKLLAKSGYFIFEFPNKRHWKALSAELAKGNFTFPLDIFPKEVGGETESKSSLPFTNYHPDLIKRKLEASGMKIISMRSVSNIRVPFLKRYFSPGTLMAMERKIQTHLVKLYFGPSIFVLAKKK